MSKTVILDGGMGRELKRIGAPFRQPEWSALALWEAPHFVEQAHDAFVQAGAQVITSNSYAVVPFHIGEQRFASDGARLAALSGELARKAAAKAAQPVRVAGSLPPALGSYRPDLFDESQALAILQVLVGALAPHVDLWLAETQSSLAEVRAVKQALAGQPQPLWLSFTLQDEDGDGVARLRSGETVTAAVAEAIRLGAAAVLFNCSQPEVMAAALDAANVVIAREQANLQLGVYANAFPPTPKDAKANATLDDIRADLTPRNYAQWAALWVEKGASVVGGCCGITPQHIAALAQALP